MTHDDKQEMREKEDQYRLVEIGNNGDEDHSPETKTDISQEVEITTDVKIFQI